MRFSLGSMTQNTLAPVLSGWLLNKMGTENWVLQLLLEIKTKYNYFHYLDHTATIHSWNDLSLKLVHVENKIKHKMVGYISCLNLKEERTTGQKKKWFHRLSFTHSLNTCWICIRVFTIQSFQLFCKYEKFYDKMLGKHLWNTW